MDTRPGRVAIAIVAGALLAAGCTDDQTTSEPVADVCEAGLPDVIVWMEPTATDDDHAGAQKALESEALVDSWWFVDAEASNEEFERLFADNPDLIDALSAETLPTSYRTRITGADGDAIQALAARLDGGPGIRDVTRPTLGCR